MTYRELVTSIGNHSIDELPKEACGIITKKFKYIKCRNMSPTPKTSFILEPQAIIKHANNIWGFFHSHPYSKDPVPSDRDLEMLSYTQYKFLVGFNNNLYIYKLSDNGKIIFERFNEGHCKS
jgi:proteasome lid subunit RPN8/RPN11